MAYILCFCFNAKVSKHNTLDDMYYLGDDFSAAGYDNCDGGGNQQNNAHLVEMLAALSIIDFAGKQSQQNAVKNTNFHEFVFTYFLERNIE